MSYPYITYRKTGFRNLIDSGSTKSFIKKIIAETCYGKNLKHTPFEVITRHGTTKEEPEAKEYSQGTRREDYTTSV